MTDHSPPKEPKLVVGPLALVALVALWRGARRRKPVTLAVGAAAAAAEIASPGYRRFKRRWTLFSITDD